MPGVFRLSSGLLMESVRAVGIWAGKKF